MRFDAEFDGFYTKCLAELRGRANWTEAFIPMLDRYVMLTAKLNQLNEKLADQAVIHEHTNKADKTNTVSNPEWRMFLALNKEANQLAQVLQLTPATAPQSSAKEKKGFNLDKPMRIAK
jgi:hypothetical protein